ncbi:MAG: 1-deoxy-D-xylulose-5-phosphate synthase [Candidatus Omnitrophota bacterium]|nr:MAG: 1-deoxy-D-xylulose-5-phosphate synthase [Candidatus Omnitrophota bacterium]
MKNAIDFRNAFFDNLYDIAIKNKEVVFITSDMPAESLVKYNKDFPDRFINSRVAEQNTVSVAAGLALSGKKVFIYGMLPFVTMRCYEQIKVDICSMNLPVTLIGLGAGLSFDVDGPTAHGVIDIAIMRSLPEMTILNPSDPITASAFAETAYSSCTPTYIRLHKGRTPSIYDNATDFSDGFSILKNGDDLCIITTGVMLHTALRIRDELKRYSLDAGVIDLYQLKPIKEDLFLKALTNHKKIVTIEEHSLIGGLGSIISEIITDNQRPISLKRIALKDEQCFHYGKREWLREVYKVDADSIVKQIIAWEKK